MTYAHLGPFSDWVGEAHRQRRLRPPARPGRDTMAVIREQLGFANGDEHPVDVRTGREWQGNGVRGEEVSWSVGYGPRTVGWLLRPNRQSGPLPGVLALHDHGGVKFFGKEKITDGPDLSHPLVRQGRARTYGGRAFANDLARRGFVVLAHDTFSWSSRRFPLDVMPEWMRGNGADPEAYNRAAVQHEHILEKYCSLLGTTLAGVVSHEDRIALDYLVSRPEVDPDRLGCIGLSGGGCRSALLQATCEQIRAAVIVGQMSTHEALLDRHVAAHTWMFLPPGLAAHADWPDVAAARAPSPLLVQYDRDDELFPLRGMHDADRRIAMHYATVGRSDAYRSEFYDGPHKFDLAMQDSAFTWLGEQLAR